MTSTRTLMHTAWSFDRIAVRNPTTHEETTIDQSQLVAIYNAEGHAHLYIDRLADDDLLVVQTHRVPEATEMPLAPRICIGSNGLAYLVGRAR